MSGKTDDYLVSDLLAVGCASVEKCNLVAAVVEHWPVGTNANPFSSDEPKYSNGLMQSFLNCKFEGGALRGAIIEGTPPWTQSPS